MNIVLASYILLVAGLANLLASQKSLKQSIKDGEMVYQDFCLQCHLAKGEGVESVFPPLAKADFLLQNVDKSIAAIKYGMKGPVTVNGIKYDGQMVNMGLEDEEIADVMNYILNSWGNSYDEQITVEKVESITEE